MTVDLQFVSAALSDSPLRVVAMHGREALSSPFRFDVEVTSTDPALPLDDLIGQAAELTIAERKIAGVVSEVVQGGRRDDGYVYQFVLVPRLWLLSLGKMSRAYQNLSTPEIVAAVLSSTGTQVAVEERLAQSYPPRRCVMQYAESPLAFVSRLLESEGIAYRIRSDEDGERLVLSDHNDAYDEVERASMEASRDGAQLLDFTCRRQLVPKRLLLQDHDHERPDLPLQALAEVDAAGFGIDVMHAAGFRAPEQGARMAALRAEAMRGEATRYQGSTEQALAAGTRLAMTGHFRSDFDGDFIVTDLRHTFDGGRYRVRFEARSVALPFRPALRTPRPRIDGVLPARVDAVEANATAATDAQGRYRVVMPFDSSGAGVGGGSGPVPLLSPDEGMRFDLRRGAPVMLSFLSGDPDRPVISGAVPPGRAPLAPATKVIRTPQGGIIEMSGKYAEQPEGQVHSVRGELAREQQLTGDDNWTETNDDNADNDWVRFAVPHDGGWSYLRYGAQTSTGVVAGAGENTTGEFTEQAYLAPTPDAEGNYPDTEHTYNSKYIGDDGDTASTEGSGFPWKWSDLDSADFHTNFSSSDQSTGGKSFFGHDASAGVYDYTDGNRTVITQGSQQTVTRGHRTDVVLGDYRLIIPKRTNGVYDADVYGMRYRKAAGHWRKTEWSHVSADTYAWGDTESFFWGTTFDLAGGISMSGFLGGQLEATVALGASLNLGASVEASIGDKLVYTKGDERTSSSTNLVSAKKTITMAIGSQSWHANWLDGALAAGAGILGVASTVGTMVNVDSDNPNTSLISSAVLGGLAILSGGVLATRLLMDDAKDPEGYPRIVLDKDDGLKMEVSADNVMTFQEDGLLIKVGGDNGSILQMTSEGAMLRAGAGPALLLTSDGVAAMTPNGDTLTASTAGGDLQPPLIGVDADLAAIVFSDAIGVGAEAAGVDIVE